MIIAYPEVASLARALSRANAATRFGPATSFADDNAILEIHEDTPGLVRRRYREAGITRLRFQCIEMPIDEQMTPQYEQITPMARSEPYMSYAGGSARVISFNLAFASSVEQNDGGQMDMALQNVRWIQSLMLPTTDGGGRLLPPPLCRLVLGRTIAARGIVTGFNPQFEQWSGDESPFEYPILCRGGFEFTVVNTRMQEIRDFLPLFGARAI